MTTTFCDKFMTTVNGQHLLCNAPRGHAGNCSYTFPPVPIADAAQADTEALRAEMRKLAEELRAECNIACVACSENWDLGLHGCHYEPIPPDWPKEDDFDSQSQPCKARSKRKVIKCLESLAGRKS